MGSLREELLAFMAPREERVALGGIELVVKEWPMSADFGDFRGQTDSQYLFVVGCVFDDLGMPVFTTDDIPAIKAASSKKLMPLIAAVNRVNGFDIEDERKNSSASPADE